MNTQTYILAVLQMVIRDPYPLTGLYSTDVERYILQMLCASGLLTHRDGVADITGKGMLVFKRLRDAALHREDDRYRRVAMHLMEHSV